jgi:hypothetical protein
MFYKLTLVCFDVWANEMAPKLQGLSRFKEKFDVLKSARVEFPKDRRQYNEGLSYILESLGDLEISLCDFTQDISDLPSRIESSTLNISTGQYDPILPQSQVPKIPIESSKSGQKTTSINQQPAITQSSFSKPGLSYVAAPINEVLESQECSEIVAEQSKIDTDRGTFVLTS